MTHENKLAQFVASLRYEDLPEEVVDSTKKHILDTVGVILAGSKYSLCKQVVKQIEEWKGSKESTIYVFGNKVPCHNAAIANGMMARALDFGGVYEKVATHPNEPVIPAALSLGEKSGATGKELIAAVAAGLELICRLKLAGKGRRGFTGEGTLGAAAASARILKLDELGTLNALGIAFSMASGTLQMVQENCSYNHVSHGMRASAGILACQLASLGVTGPKGFLDGDYGIFNVYENQEECDVEEIRVELGKRYELRNISLKPYPTCRFNHAAIDGTIDLVNDNNLDVQNIKEIRIGVNQLAYNLNCTPIEKKIKPTHPIEAQFSIPYLIGVAVVERDVFIDHVTEERYLSNETIGEMAKKVKCYIDDEKIISSESGKSMGARIGIKTETGQEYESVVRVAKGHYESPMTMDEVAEKVKKCALNTIRPMRENQVSKMIELFNQLEKMRDISIIPGLISEDSG